MVNFLTTVFILFHFLYFKGPPCEGMPGQQAGKVPIMRMFGVNDNGNSICCHVHGFSPYLYVTCPPIFKESHLGAFKVSIHVLWNEIDCFWIQVEDWISYPIHSLLNPENIHHRMPSTEWWLLTWNQTRKTSLMLSLQSTWPKRRVSMVSMATRKYHSWRSP